jgi:hypothetical protein
VVAETEYARRSAIEIAANLPATGYEPPARPNSMVVAIAGRHAELRVLSGSEGVATIDEPGRRDISSNIGEGKRRKRQRAFLYHLDIALGSQAEVEVQLEIARRVGLLAPSDSERIQGIVEEVGRMLNGLIGSMQEDRIR